MQDVEIQEYKLLYQVFAVAYSNADLQVPKYQQVLDTIKTDILSGRYQPGQKLPSEAGFLKRFGTSRITVGRALRELQQAGLVQRIISICRRSWKRSRIPRAARRFSTRWPTARRLPGGTSTCSASMTSRQKSCGTASGSGSQNWGAKKEVFWT
jgi:DNA-binding transcriptional MocR family regulator